MDSQKKKITKTYTVRIAVTAVDNINEITGYIAFVKQQPLNAVKVGDDLFSTIESIQVSPFSYKECDEIPTKTKMYRRAVCHSWHVIYRIKKEEILILGIIHHTRRSSKIKKLKKVK